MAGSVDRRTVLRAGLMAGGAALLGRPGVAGAQAAPAGTPDARGLVPGIDYLPSPMPGVPDAFLRAPQPYRSVAEVPGRDGTVTLLTLLFGPPPPGRDDNPYWRELERRLGVTWDVAFVPYEQYGERTATTIAGGDLPDLFYVNEGVTAAHLNQAIQQGAFADLTDYLTGDAIAAYPNLAAIDPAIFRNISVDGRIFGIPKLVPRFDTPPFFRADWAATLGLAEPTTADEFFGLMTAFTENDPDGDGTPNTWGLGGASGGWNVTTLMRMFGAPNGWRVEPDGGLIYFAETEEFRRTVEFCRRMNEAGLYHPDTATMSFEQEESALLGGEISLQSQGFATFLGNEGIRGRIKDLNPAADLRGLILPAADGGRPVTHNGSGAYGFTAISASVARDEARVDELLRIMDYLLAPFGSEEQIFLETGLEGVHHTVDANGARVLTEQGRTEVGLYGYFPLVWMARPEPQAFFYPAMAGEARYAQELAVRILGLGIDNPTIGLFSATNAEKGGELDQLFTDRIGAIVTGRAEPTALADFVAEWKRRGGDQIRQEYQEQLAKR